MTTTIFGALLGGILSLLSPCSVMLLPAFFSYAFSSPGKLVGRTAVFYLGLITTLVPLGVLAGTVGAFFNKHRELFIMGASVVLIALGVIMLANIAIPYVTAPVGHSTVEGSGAVAVYVLGTIYGIAGMCAGPLLGAVLTASALGGDALYGGVLMLVFAAGMVVPLVVLALIWDRVPRIKNLVRPKELRIGKWRNTLTGVIGGVLLIVVGVLMWLTQGFQTITGIGGVDLAFTVENQAARIGAAVPNWLVLVAVVIIAVVGVLLARRKQRKTTEKQRVIDNIS